MELQLNSVPNKQRARGGLTEMTRIARSPLPCLVQASRSRAEFLEASRSRGAVSQDAARSRRSRGSPAAPREQTPSTKLLRTPGSVSSLEKSTARPSSETSTGRTSSETSPLAILVVSAAPDSSMLWVKRKEGRSRSMGERNGKGIGDGGTRH